MAKRQHNQPWKEEFVNKPKRIKAEARQALRDARTDQEQIELLHTRPGLSGKEQNRLVLRIGLTSVKDSSINKNHEANQANTETNGETNASTAKPKKAKAGKNRKERKPRGN